MWAFIALLTQADPSGASDLPSAFVAYGIAAPLCLFLYFWGRSNQKQAEEARAEAKKSAERVIEVVERTVPALKDATDALTKSTEATERLSRRLDRET